MAQEDLTPQIYPKWKVLLEQSTKAQESSTKAYNFLKPLIAYLD